jgi:hypothetical protein
MVLDGVVLDLVTVSVRCGFSVANWICHSWLSMRSVHQRVGLRHQSWGNAAVIYGHILILLLSFVCCFDRAR